MCTVGSQKKKKRVPNNNNKILIKKTEIAKKKLFKCDFFLYIRNKPKEK